jgi:hypothetical protein
MLVGIDFIFIYLWVDFLGFELLWPFELFHCMNNFCVFMYPNKLVSRNCGNVGGVAMRVSM